MFSSTKLIAVFLYIFSVSFALELYSSSKGTQKILQIQEEHTHNQVLIDFFKENNISQKELEDFSQSKAWRKLLYYKRKKNESLVKSRDYFLSKNGNISPLEELKSSLYILSKLMIELKNQQYYQCLFPARTSLLKSKWPNLIKKTECLEFEEWKKSLDAGNLYMVYSSAYPNNPASMFGHTFLRLDREKRTQQTQSKSILGYSLSFQALTNPNENAILYTFKGITGGYPAGLQIKPHYIDIGIYNNQESRDLWEYHIDLSSHEKNFLIEHLWELSLSVKFDYYFFDQNCSTYLLFLLEVIKPHLDFQTKENIFVVPQETLREVHTLLGAKSITYKESIKEKLQHNYLNLQPQQKRKFKAWKKKLGKKISQNDIIIIDMLVDYWKHKNYRAHNNLSLDQRKMMIDVFNQRASFDIESKLASKPRASNKEPHKAHKRSKFQIGFDNKLKTYFNINYGFHDIGDLKEGYQDNAYIDLFDISFFEQNKTWIADLLDIKSLENIHQVIPSISWRGLVQHQSNESQLYQGVYALAGISQEINKNLKFFSLAGIGLQHKAQDQINIHYAPYILNLGGYYLLKSNFTLTLDSLTFYHNTKRLHSSHVQIELLKNFELFTLSIGSRQLFNKKNLNTISIKSYF